MLAGTETDIRAPYLAERMRILARTMSRGTPGTYITKRNYGWCCQENVDRLIASVREENIGIISIVRDPRDVMSSIHAAADQSKRYVTVEHWLQSIRATEQIFTALDDYPGKLEVRYEDVVTDPDRIAKDIGAQFSLEANDAGRSFSMIKENVAGIEAEIDRNLLLAVHKVRNLDSRSVGRWKSDREFVDSDAYKFICDSSRNPYFARHEAQVSASL